jgi:hypothetical protein
MKTAVKLFIIAATFGALIAIVYWIVSKEVIGTFLLGVMGAALLFAAGYIVIAEREANLAGDRPDAAVNEDAGTRIGAFLSSSSVPILSAIGAGTFLVGLVYSSGLAILGLAVLCAALGRGILES